MKSSGAGFVTETVQIAVHAHSNIKPPKNNVKSQITVLDVITISFCYDYMKDVLKSFFALLGIPLGNT